ncbi:efflux RND transporter periplasmic adaptor subunit [Caulobacter sp. FWC2]|uniref:efflux RND transporter periplasmic adaptor subunit n=1 Tax=Caulobacter sp. FWC2 TaxID=69664 RepID=UPI000C150A65|nr:efflux RND transporter periplasmic adaptor subunit [Caulobacter sp. FWC2]PIB90915.1 efflux transporter periplasmic adaptor subunit [Caulobacter sp. FWC2]
MSESPPPPAGDYPKTSPKSLRRLALIGGAGFVLILAAGTASRLMASQDLKKTSQASALTTVHVIQPGGGESADLVLPGRLQAWAEAPVYARTDGYLRRWYVDIGQPVKAGQVLAEIDAPEVDQQLVAARAALATAQAQRDLAATTAARWKRLVGENAVSQQEADERAGDLAAREAMRNEALANVRRLESLTAFKRIVAPFDGVVTSRDTDQGALISAGGARPSPLFTVSDTRRLRLYVSVPQSLAGQIRPGMSATFASPDLPGQTFNARVVRTADAVDAQSGAMLIQLEVDNAAGALKPGAYAQVSLDLKTASPTTASAVRIPSNALLFRKEGTAVAVVGGDNTVSIRPVKIARDDGAELELASGVAASDWIVTSPPDAIATGDHVNVVKAKTGAAGAKG